MFVTVVKWALIVLLYSILRVVVSDLPAWLQERLGWTLFAFVLYRLVNRYFQLIKDTAEMATRQPRDVRRGQIVYVEWICDRPAARCRVMQTVHNNERPIPLKLLEDYGPHNKNDVLFAQTHEFMTAQEWHDREGTHDEAL